MSIDDAESKLIEDPVSLSLNNDNFGFSNVGMRLRLLRDVLDISQRELAKRAGLTNSSISMIEQGQVSPSIQSLERILASIPLEIASFFNFSIEQPAPSVKLIGHNQQNIGALLPANSRLKPSFDFIPPGVTGKFHFANSEIVGVVLEGVAILRTLNGTQTLINGEVVVIPAKQLYQFINQGTLPAKLFFCSFFTPN
ncbi:MAG TPA: helix-turn-helix domain-containing protein [Cellvibrio sp.]|nr:helix-turn-helix domain-containing protein [Cellvibrio sp.]